MPGTCTERGLTSSMCILLGMNNEQQLRPLLLRHMVLLLSGLSLLFVRWRVMASATPTFQRVDNPASFADRILTRVMKSVELFLNIRHCSSFLLCVSNFFHKSFKIILTVQYILTCKIYILILPGYF